MRPDETTWSHAMNKMIHIMCLSGKIPNNPRIPEKSSGRPVIPNNDTPTIAQHPEFFGFGGTKTLTAQYNVKIRINSEHEGVLG